MNIFSKEGEEGVSYLFFPAKKQHLEAALLRLSIWHWDWVPQPFMIWFSRLPDLMITYDTV